jgi:hypothetical protein
MTIKPVDVMPVLVGVIVGVTVADWAVGATVELNALILICGVVVWRGWSMFDRQRRGRKEK